MARVPRGKGTVVAVDCPCNDLITGRHTQGARHTEPPLEVAFLICCNSHQGPGMPRTFPGAEDLAGI